MNLKKLIGCTDRGKIVLTGDDLYVIKGRVFGKTATSRSMLRKLKQEFKVL